MQPPISSFSVAEGADDAERFRRIAHDSPAGIFETDAAGEYTFVSAEWCRLADLAAASALGTGWLASVHELDRTSIASAWREAVAERKRFSANIRFVHRNGTTVWTRAIARPVVDHRGRLWHYVGSVADITDFVELTVSLRDAVGDAEESRERFRVLADALPNLVWMSDAKGQIEYVNPRWRDYTGFDVARLAVEGQKGIVHEDELQRTWDAWGAALQTGRPYEVAHRLRSAHDRRFRWFLTRSVPVKNEGEIVCWVGTSTEIDEQVRSNERLRFASSAASALASSLDPEEIVQSFTRLAIDSFSETCVVAFRTGDGVQIERFEARSEGLQTARAGDSRDTQSWRTPFQAVLESGEATLIDANAERVSATSSAVLAPIAVAGQTLGAVAFGRTHESAEFTRSDLETASAVAHQLAVAVENARSFVRQRDAARRFRILARTTEQLFASLDVSRTFQRLVDSIVGEIGDFAAAYFIEEDDAIRTVAIAHHDPEKRAFLEELAGARAMTPAAERRVLSDLRAHRATIANDVPAEALHAIVRPYLLASFSKLAPRAALTVPLFAGQQTFGALVAYSERPGRYTTEDVDLLEEIARRASLALEHARSFERERRVAQTLQEASLPATLPSPPGVELSAAYVPATADVQVGGDWYDAVELDEGRLFLSIGDVTGSGLQSAVIMSKLRQALNVVAMYESDPARILDAAERTLLRRMPDAIATAFVAVLDVERREMTYASAGHPPPLVLRRDGRVEEVASEGLPLGIRAMGGPAISRRCTIDDAAFLVLYTDGLTEAHRDLLAGMARLTQMTSTRAIRYVSDPAGFLRRTCLPSEVRDDVAILVAAFPTATHWTFDAENARAAQDARGDFMSRLRAVAATDSDFSSAELIFGELVGNVVRHAPGPIDIVLEWNGEFPRVHVVDRGPGFTFQVRKADVLSESGRGLWLMETLGRDVEVEAVPGFGTHVAVTLPVRGAPAS